MNSSSILRVRNDSETTFVVITVEEIEGKLLPGEACYAPERMAELLCIYCVSDSSHIFYGKPATDN